MTLYISSGATLELKPQTRLFRDINNSSKCSENKQMSDENISHHLLSADELTKADEVSYVWEYHSCTQRCSHGRYVFPDAASKNGYMGINGIIL